MSSKSIAVHITSILIGAAGLIALVHPGFALPTIAIVLVPIVCTAAVALMQIAHNYAKHTLAFNLAALERAARAVAKDYGNVTAVTTDTPTPLAVKSDSTVADEAALSSDLASPPPLETGNFPAVNNKLP